MTGNPGLRKRRKGVKEVAGPMRKVRQGSGGTAGPSVVGIPEITVPI